MDSRSSNGRSVGPHAPHGEVKKEGRKKGRKERKGYVENISCTIVGLIAHKMEL